MTVPDLEIEDRKAGLRPLDSKKMEVAGAMSLRPAAKRCCRLADGPASRSAN
jgi:hypothetical protein